jgi:hypothetical protein
VHVSCCCCCCYWHPHGPGPAYSVTIEEKGYQNATCTFVRAVVFGCASPPAQALLLLADRMRRQHSLLPTAPQPRCCMATQPALSAPPRVLGYHLHAMSPGRPPAPTQHVGTPGAPAVMATHMPAGSRTASMCNALHHHSGAPAWHLPFKSLCFKHGGAFSTAAAE